MYNGIHIIYHTIMVRRRVWIRKKNTVRTEEIFLDGVIVLRKYILRMLE